MLITHIMKHVIQYEYVTFRQRIFQCIGAYKLQAGSAEPAMLRHGYFVLIIIYPRYFPFLGKLGKHIAKRSESAADISNLSFDGNQPVE